MNEEINGTTNSAFQFQPPAPNTLTIKVSNPQTRQQQTRPTREKRQQQRQQVYKRNLAPSSTVRHSNMLYFFFSTHFFSILDSKTKKQQH